jgi:tryptophanase
MAVDLFLMRTIIEPFRTKTVEPIKMTTKVQRARLLQQCGYNLFGLHAQDVIIDLLTDSGTAAMSVEQWSALIKADESYAGCESFFRFESAVQEIFGFPIVLPVHQGRAAERLLFGELLQPGQIVLNNTHFDTTRANIECLDCEAVDLPAPESLSHQSDFAFKGNIDLEQLEKLLRQRVDSVAFVMITITNNTCAGHPVSLANIRQAAEIAHRYGKMFFIDAARYAENAFLIKMHESEQHHRTLTSIVRDIFDCADGCTMSAKKDGMSNTGGFIALRDPALAQRLRNKLIVTEGFSTYGGLSGRDLETVAIGLHEALDEDYLRYRKAAADYLATGLLNVGVPVVKPTAMHAVYVDARQLLLHVEPSDLPGQAAVCELYLEAGVRSCEIGTAMFGRTGADGRQVPGGQDLVRLALPRRVYSQSHYDYVIEAWENVCRRRRSIAGMRIVAEPPQLRHFSATFEPLSATKSKLVTARASRATAAPL